MDESSPDVAATRIKDNLVLNLPSEFGPSTLEQLRQLVLDQVHENHTLAVIFDCSAVQYMDRHEFSELCVISRVVMVLGARPCFAGLRPGVVKYLVQADADCPGIKTYFDLNAALDHFAAQKAGV